MNKKKHRSLVLIILDGFGYRTETEANAIAKAHTPCWDRLWNNHPHTLLQGSGPSVGLPPGQMGNSEVGHLTMGAGRIIYQDLTRIDLAIKDGTFFTNPILIQALTEAREAKKAAHVLGLLSPGGVHSHQKHLHALLKLATQLNVSTLYIHAFLDGRDTPPESALPFLLELEESSQQLGIGKIVSIVGRYYAMDRDKRFLRIQKAYELLVSGKEAYQVGDVKTAVLNAYKRGESDEFISPTAIHPPGENPISIENGDTVIFMNFRADRAREITEAFIDPDFKGFIRNPWPRLHAFVSLTEYDPRFHLPVAFPPQSLTQILPEYLSQKGYRQLRIAETEKYAHITFFFNGGIETPYPFEERILIPSPSVATYDLVPEMSAHAITEQLIKAIKASNYDFIVCNFANPDMVGHTGNFAATVKAIETIDQCLQSIVKAAQETLGEVLITADHGNAELMFDPDTNQPHTAHTQNLVPFIYVGRKAHITHEEGNLADIAPTILHLFGLKVPKEMTGHSLITLDQQDT